MNVFTILNSISVFVEEQTETRSSLLGPQTNITVLKTIKYIVFNYDFYLSSKQGKNVAGWNCRTECNMSAVILLKRWLQSSLFNINVSFTRTIYSDLV